MSSPAGWYPQSDGQTEVMAFDSAADTSLFGMAGLPDASPWARSRRRWGAAITVLSLAVLGLGVGIAYSASSARAWQDTASRSAAELTAARGQLDKVQDRLAGAQSQLEATRQDLTDLTVEYNAANGKALDRARTPSRG